MCDFYSIPRQMKAVKLSESEIASDESLFISAVYTDVGRSQKSKTS